MPQELPGTPAAGKCAVPPENAAALWLAEEWGRQVTRAVESMTGESALITVCTAPARACGDRSIAAGVAVVGPAPQPGSRCQYMGGRRARSWEEIGNRVLRSAGVDDATPEDVRSTYLEIVNQSLSGVASAISTRARKEISCVQGRSAPPRCSRAPAFIPSRSPWASRLFRCSRFLLPPSRISPMTRHLPRLNQLPNAQAASPTAKAGPKGSIDLLLDVELPVIVSFGRAQLMLKDVIKLTTGSIVELNRALSEPVEVIVNNCVIARGEVVVVEGNYGIRIKQVISRQERLRTLY